MHEGSKKFPVPYELLLVQADFLRSKKQYEKALRIAKLAATRAPSEFHVWAKLATIFIDMDDYESVWFASSFVCLKTLIYLILLLSLQALLAINTCPMLTNSQPDEHRFPAPARTHLPLKLNALEPNFDAKTAPNNHGTLQESNDPRELVIHPELERLPSATLQGTFKKAYSLLSFMCLKMGWEELLNLRSKVFVMEDEYRVHRAMAEEEAQANAGKLEEDEIEEAQSEMENISLDDAAASLQSPKKKGKMSIDELMKKASNNPNLSTAFATNEAKLGKVPVCIIAVN